MKIAHLVLAHANPEQIKRLIGKLMHEDAHFYIHLDKKTDITPFLFLAQKGKVFFVKKRLKVYWAGYSIVQATVNSFEEILASGHTYSHINLISGQDYPIKATASIHDFFAKHPGKIFMHFLSVKNEWKEAIPRITRYHLVRYKQVPGVYLAEQLINAVMPKRHLPEGIIAMGRSQWFTATSESIAYIIKYIKEEHWISRFFKLSWAPDEMIFQTILYNSVFRENMINDNLLYVDWSAGAASPKTLTMDDAQTLKNADKLFARKFDLKTESAIFDYIDSITS